LAGTCGPTRHVPRPADVRTAYGRNRMKRRSALAAGAIVAALGTATATSMVAAASGAARPCGIACRGDIRHLPAPLKNRLILLHHRPSTFDPMTAFSEAPKRSRLFQYYLLDTKHFQPNVF